MLVSPAVLFVLISLVYSLGCNNAAQFQTMRLILDSTEISQDGVAVSRPHTFCYRGIWTVHSGSNLFHSPEEICKNASTFGSWTGPYTYFGNRDLEFDQLNIYGDTFFKEKLFSSADANVDLFNNTRPHLSYVLTGSSYWSIYELPHFEGRFFCLGPANYFPYSFATDVRPQLYPFSEARSIRKGCSKESKLYVPMEIPTLL